MKRNWHLRIRKLHRYLGLVLGIQFLLWTTGGLYFSWSNMDEIHGDHHRHLAPALSTNMLVSPTVVTERLRGRHPELVVSSLQLIDLLGQAVYQVVYQENAGHKSPKRVQLALATTGQWRSSLSRSEAVALAKSRFHGTASIEKVEYLTSTDAHHEYRESLLPAYAIHCNHPSRTTVYVAAKLGTVGKFRNEKWRIFDFLWMLHTTDYATRDNFSNLLLRAFSLLGLVTILSGFLLFLCFFSFSAQSPKEMEGSFLGFHLHWIGKTMHHASGLSFIVIMYGGYYFTRFVGHFALLSFGLAHR
jgi:hypothetical protein